MKNLQILATLILIVVAPSVQATQPTSYYIYDESGHVIGEYDANGNPVQEHIYLGDRPVAVVQGGSSSGGTVDYVTTDQLNTPRAITDGSGAVLWSWNSDPFGNGQPAGSLADNQPYNLRFPGQYFDAETGRNYNFARDYDPAVGRYVESDPFGLHGGINTYVYAKDDPLALSDPTGKNPVVIAAAIVIAAYVAIDAGISWWEKYTGQIQCQQGCLYKFQCALNHGDTRGFDQCKALCTFENFGGSKTQSGPLVQ